ncbi:MAG: hypothetical protein M3065_14710 [Actinomycetota bacterium]|nr:hypothetical protein [Actinomycetota bacterium]
MDFEPGPAPSEALMGAIVSATRQDLDAARRARESAELLFDHHQLR